MVGNTTLRDAALLAIHRVLGVDLPAARDHPPPLPASAAGLGTHRLFTHISVAVAASVPHGPEMASVGGVAFGFAGISYPSPQQAALSAWASLQTQEPSGSMRGTT